MFCQQLHSELEQMMHVPSKRQQKYSSKLGFCKVCGDIAKVINYGALSCQPCKTFFRRNGCHPERVPSCVNNDVCDITKETRRSCPSCRLAKCFLKGMCSDLIRKEELRSKRSSSTWKYKNHIYTDCKSAKSSTQLWISDQMPYKQYLLLDHQKKILFNVIRALDIFSAIPVVRSMVNDELAIMFDLPFDETDAIQCINHIYTSLRSFINCTPDFQMLVTGEQSALLQRNFTGIVNLYSALVFRHTDIMNRPDLIRSFAFIYGSEMILELIHISRQLDVDLTIIKLLLLIVAFSSNCSAVYYHPQIPYDRLLTGTHRLLGSQNDYVIVLWKYMVCQYGYYKAACHFGRLIQFLLTLIKSTAMTYANNPIYYQLVNEFNENTEQLLNTNQGKQVCRWGII